VHGWTAEDGGPRRQQWLEGAQLNLAATETLQVTSRTMMVVTMVVMPSPDELFVLCHTGGDDAVSWVEQVHPETLETLATSDKLPGGRAWPGGIAVHPKGDLYVVFGNHAHRLNRQLHTVVSRELPRLRPYNSFVLLPDGHLVTKDFSGSRPGNEVAEPFDSTELVVLEPDNLRIVSTLELPEASIARLSADDDDIYVIGTSALWRAMDWIRTRAGGVSGAVPKLGGSDLWLGCSDCRWLCLVLGQWGVHPQICRHATWSRHSHRPAASGPSVAGLGSSSPHRHLR